MTFPTVSKKQSILIPYPIVYVEDDLTVREVNKSEREYLEEEFDPCDGNRPYVKDSYKSKSPGGSYRGFCIRSLIPKEIEITVSKKQIDITKINLI